MLEDHIDVRWGDFSIVECELALFKEAIQGKYDYYHLLSGVDIPIKPTNYILDFFETNRGKEFFSVVNDSENKKLIWNNTNFYHLFTREMKTKFGRVLSKFKIPSLSIEVQKLLRIHRCEKDVCPLYKGDQWMSITDDAVRCILHNEDFIKYRFKYTNCPDEIYKQTILVNSGFGDKVYSPLDNGNSSLHSIDWKRGRPYTWRFSDLKELVNSNNIFARKFSMSIDSEIVNWLRDNI